LGRSEAERGPDWVFALFAGKTFSLLALCFGFSFWVMMERAARRGSDFSLRFAWRLALLAGIGWLHGLVYRGDIIVVLALARFAYGPPEWAWRALTWTSLDIPFRRGPASPT
jgi:uncharacterized membrane protein YeiB